MAYLLEPQNSWEVSYVITIRRPNFKLDITRLEAFREIGKDRAKDLEEWAWRFFNYKWLIDHTVYRPYIKLDVK